MQKKCWVCFFAGVRGDISCRFSRTLAKRNNPICWRFGGRKGQAKKSMRVLLNPGPGRVSYPHLVVLLWQAPCLYLGFMVTLPSYAHTLTPKQLLSSRAVGLQPCVPCAWTRNPQFGEEIGNERVFLRRE